MDNQLDTYLARLNLEGARNVWENNKPKIDSILEKATNFAKTGGKVCEIGVGNGYLLDRLYDLGMDCTGMDISEYLIDFHKRRLIEERKTIELIQFNIGDKYYRENIFDTVFCVDILEHLDEIQYKQAIENIYKAMKREGIFVLTVPFNENLDLSMTKCPQCGHEFHRIGHKQTFDLERLQDTISPFFRIIEIGEVRASTPVAERNKKPIYRRALDLTKRVWKIKQRVRLSLSFGDRDKNEGNHHPLRQGATCYLIAVKDT